MGGGDLNSKKSWHPNTMKNQERVWKAEQAAAEEKKRIMELQHERAVERDRADLNEMAKRNAGIANNDDRLHWMYDKPDKKGQAEDYLLGRTIEKSYDQPEKSDDVIPAVARRVIGSSMMTAAEDSQVDLVRKMREDPLLLVKERERAARAALLNNPLHRKRIADLLRKEQEQQKGSKVKKAKKKEKDLDSMLAAKLNALGGEKGVDVAALLASDDSSSSSEASNDKNTKKKKKKNSKKSKISKKDSATESSDEDTQQKVRNKDRNQVFLNRSQLHKESRKHRSESRDSDKNVGLKKDVSKDNIYKGENQRNRDKRSESQEFNRNVRNKQKSSEKRRIYEDYQTESRKGNSESYHRETYKEQYRRDVSEDNKHDRYWSQQIKRSEESDIDVKDKSNQRDISTERRPKGSRKDRSESREFTCRRNKTESYRKKEFIFRKQRSVSHDSARETKNKRSRRDSSADRKNKKGSDKQDKNKRSRKHSPENTKYEEVNRKERSLSRDFNKQAKDNRGRRDSSEDRPNKEHKKKHRSLSRDSGKQYKNKRSRIDSSGERKYKKDKRNERSASRESRNQAKDKRDRRDISEDNNQKHSQYSRGRDYDYSRNKRDTSERRSPEKNRGWTDGKEVRSKKAGLSEEEKAARLAEMAAAGVEREVQRGRRVAEQRAVANAEETAPRRPRAHNDARALPESLESRIHSNRHYIQRNQSHMNEHFARR